jgi:hypothetical protein
MSGYTKGDRGRKPELLKQDEPVKLPARSIAEHPVLTIQVIRRGGSTDQA